MIIFSSFRALGAMIAALALFSVVLQHAAGTAAPPIALFFIGLGLMALGRYLARPFAVNTIEGTVLHRRRHTVFFIPIWIWGIIFMIMAVPMAVNPGLGVA